MNWGKYLVMQMKGQSAIEYLTTYGWMLIVVAVAGGTIFSVIQNSGQIKETSGLANSDIRIEEFAITSGGGLDMVLRAATAEQVYLRNVVLKSSENSSKKISKDLDLSIAVGGTETISLENVGSSETVNNFDITFTYNLGGLTGLTTNGKIKAPIKIVKTVVENLLASGDKIESIKISASLRSNSSNPVCIGESCPTTTSPKLSGTEKYVNRSGDEMTGTLKTDKIEFGCLGNNCSTSTGSLDGYVNSVNNTMDGTLNVTEVKPINAPVCLGESC